MLFSSIGFIYYFLPLMLCIYYITPNKYKNLSLGLGSVLFYFIGEPVYTFILLLSIIIDYSHSLIIERHRGKPQATIALSSSIILNLLLLGVFKYGDFTIDNLNRFFGFNIQSFNLSLPIGISFFTFQTMSYSIDVYRGDGKVQRKFSDLLTYITMFPQLIAGPIVRYKSIATQLENRKHSIGIINAGIQRFIVGLGKKVLIANTLGEFNDIILKSQHENVMFYWISAIVYTLQLYYDFSGYSDMAIGLGKLFGFDFPENFNYPLISKSITEFWRRWHISLGMWFRDYVYIPLGGNRVHMLLWIRNIAVVWFLTGLWHGASWNFILWGIYFGIVLIIEKFLIGKYLKKCNACLQHFYTLFIIITSFVIFSTDDITLLLLKLKGMFGLRDIALYTKESVYYVKSYFFVLIIGTIGATPLPKIMFATLLNKIQKKGLKWINVLHATTLIFLLILITSFLVEASFNPFLYFRF